jgi:hypothetical protein
MAFPRASSLVLALGGSFGAFFLLAFTYEFLHYSAGGLLWLLLWLPGFLAWYAYIRHCFGHYLFAQARITWLVSLAANTWSLFLIGDRSSTALAWIILALALSVVCAVKEWRLREPEPQKRAHVTGEEFKKLLDEHHSKQR